jgi:hypothetical protein
MSVRHLRKGDAGPKQWQNGQKGKTVDSRARV